MRPILLILVSAGIGFGLPGRPSELAGRSQIASAPASVRDAVGRSWSRIGPSPAGVPAIAVDAKGSGTIFIGSVGGGIRKSVDNARTWSTVNTGLTNLLIFALVIDASGPQIVYAGSVFGGVFKTSDGGATWKELPAMAGTIVAGFAADPNRAGVVYAGLLGGALRKTTDGGATWVQVFNAMAPLWNVTLDPWNPDVVYAASLGRGAFKSVDAGQTWSSMSALTPGVIWTLAVDSVDSRVLYAGTNEDGVWKSSDAGATWQQMGSPPASAVLSLTIDRSSTHTVYAGTAGGGVWESWDDGLRWFPTGLSRGIVLSLFMDSTMILYAGTGFAGVQISKDHGGTWSHLDPYLGGANGFGYGLAIDPTDNERIFVSANESGLIVSQDGGATWAVAGIGYASREPRQVVFDPSNAQRVYAGSFFAGGVFKSLDAGLTWSRRRFGSPAVYVWALAVDGLRPNVVYAGTNGDGLFKSADYGDTWTAIGTGLPSQVQGLTIDPFDHERVFAATPTGVFLSADGGATWRQVLNRPAWQITINSQQRSVVYATTRSAGVFRSVDRGNSWQDVSAGLTSLSMGRSAPVVVDPRNPQVLYVGSEAAAGGVFKTVDGGEHWFPINAGLDNRAVYGLVTDPSDPALLYACGPDGVYKYSREADEGRK